MSLTVEDLKESDRDEWLRLWEGYLTFYESQFDDATTASTFSRLLDPAVGLHGAIARGPDGSAVGLVHWLTHPATWTTKDYCYLEDLFVAPTARSNGAGEALIRHVTDWARANGSAKVYWLTAETNEVARRLYDRMSDRTGFIHYQVRL